MPVTIPERRKPPSSPSKKPSLLRRLGWFFLLYALGVGVVAIVAYGLKLWIRP